MPKPLDSSFFNDLKTEHDAAGYPLNWNKISAAFRKALNYTCAVCKICCESHTNLVDAHHINGDKSNCDYGNLQCLCKYCHSKQDFHSHYKPKLQQLEILRLLWQEQEILSPEKN